MIINYPVSTRTSLYSPDSFVLRRNEVSVQLPAERRDWARPLWQSWNESLLSQEICKKGILRPIRRNALAMLSSHEMLCPFIELIKVIK